MLSLIWWIAIHAVEALFLVWVLRSGGAERIEGTWASGFISGFAPRWNAEGLRMAALILLVFCAITFVVGLFMPSLRCWSSGAC
ncbi:hypothetical protein NU688_11530 [Variovorax sp. ZS18.2.2]|uniref:hypothetical protein n=1 Tax=Variovorax sp. ZS18.2.2 TaxID=2971255 RepID=UPI002150F686|nr:hypothetical protein [Variovorax sp. ZS18.2.2]MCR6476779.1 hypothetical protein [Variovorax sp. ZS18.2.2]